MIVTCKNCGTRFDMSRGVCPACGAPHGPMAGAGDVDDTKVWGVPEREEPVYREDIAERQTRPTPEDYGGEVRPRSARPQTQSGRRRRGLFDRRTAGFVVGGVFLLAVLTVILCFMSDAFKFGDKSASEYMPDVVGKTESEATAILEALDLKVEITHAESSKPAGEVIAQSVREGRRLKNISTVTLTVSSGIGGGIDTSGDSGLSTPAPIETPSPSPTPTPTPSPSPTPSEPTYDITVVSGSGGSVSPNGSVKVKEGDSVTFTFTPNAGYELSELLIDGQSVETQPTYTFTNVTGPHTVYAVFRVVPATPEPTQTPEPTAPPTEAPAPSEAPPATEPPAETDNPGE